jgi:heme oxygenase (biliverdin-IX-beta and delta-forming)
VTDGMNALTAMRATLRPHHDSIERSLNLMDGNVDRHRYVRFIERSYGFVASCERQLDLERAPEALEVERRLKTPLLRNNLASLGYTAESIDRVPLCDTLPPVGSWPSALGYFYVLEGSTLGGQLLSRHLRSSLGLSDEALAFLNGYGGGTGPMWKGMIGVLEAAMMEPDAAAAITKSARETFILLERWHG